MTGHDERPDDPRWELTLEIAGKLWLYGELVIELDPVPAQEFVDVQWAARQAGRLIGVRTELDIVPTGGGSSTVVVRITYSDPDGRGLIRAQDGLDALVRSVREQQAARDSLSRGRVRSKRPWPPPSSPS
jgi:hypothetical protein